MVVRINYTSIQYLIAPHEELSTADAGQTSRDTKQVSTNTPTSLLTTKPSMTTTEKFEITSSTYSSVTLPVTTGKIQC